MRWLIVIAMVLMAAPATAGRGPKSAELREAKQLFRRGEKHYKVGEFQQAAEAYKEAYRLSEKPALLFNIAQAYRQAKNHKQALYFYQGYLRNNPKARNRADVKRLIKELEGLIEAQNKADADAQRRQEERERVRNEAEKQRQENERRRLELERKRKEAELAELAIRREHLKGNRALRISGVIIGSLGLVSVGGGVFFGLSARSDWDEINQLAADGGRWTPAFQDQYDSAETKETLATIGLATGGAAIIAGGLMLYFGRDRSDEIELTVAPTGSGLSMVGRW